MSNILGGLLAVACFAGFVCLVDKKMRAKAVAWFEGLKGKLEKLGK
jgi:hypothetical protein